MFGFFFFFFSLHLDEGSFSSLPIYSGFGSLGACCRYIKTKTNITNILHCTYQKYRLVYGWLWGFICNSQNMNLWNYIYICWLFFIMYKYIHIFRIDKFVWASFIVWTGQNILNQSWSDVICIAYLKGCCSIQITKYKLCHNW